MNNKVANLYANFERVVWLLAVCGLASRRLNNSCGVVTAAAVVNIVKLSVSLYCSSRQQLSNWFLL